MKKRTEVNSCIYRTLFIDVGVENENVCIC